MGKPDRFVDPALADMTFGKKIVRVNVSLAMIDDADTGGQRWEVEHRA